LHFTRLIKSLSYLREGTLCVHNITLHFFHALLLHAYMYTDVLYIWLILLSMYSELKSASRIIFNDSSCVCFHTFMEIFLQCHKSSRSVSLSVCLSLTGALFNVVSPNLNRLRFSILIIRFIF